MPAPRMPSMQGEGGTTFGTLRGQRQNHNPTQYPVPNPYLPASRHFNPRHRPSGDFAGLEKNSCNQHKSVELFERKVPKAYIKCIFIEMRPGLVHGPNLVTKPSESLSISLWSLIITSNLSTRYYMIYIKQDVSFNNITSQQDLSKDWVS